MEKVSIIIPCYRHQHILPRAVNSVLNQKSPNVDFEIIIVDDGNQVPLINHWGHPVRILRHPQNLGLSNALNTGIQNSTGSYFVILASDDELDQNYLNKTTYYMNKVDVISTDFIGDTNKPVICKPGTFSDLRKANCHSYAALVRKAKYEEIPNGFKTYMNPSWEDWLFFFELSLLKATWQHIHYPLHIYHRNPTGRDEDSQTKQILLTAKFRGTHPEIFGKGVGEVSIIIPCYNQEQFLPEALESITKQIYPFIKVIIVDDGSPGNVIKASQPYQDKLNLTILRQHNKHLSGARNTGIKYALNNFNSQFLMMLDADDAIAPNYIERCFEEMPNLSTYTYTDIKFIGDAYHTYELESYRPEKLLKKHLHQCTFLAASDLYKTVYNNRQYFYDENMKRGFEDWEFALEALRNGYCGKRIAKEFLFYYRFHEKGSMRTDAIKVEPELVNYIKNKHKWIKNPKEVEMACSSCAGNNKFTRVVKTNGRIITMEVNVPTLGMVESTEMLQVVYSGGNMNTITKLGTSGTVYKYSGNPNGTNKNVFNIFARDAHLFVGNNFTFKRINQIEEVQQVNVQAKAPVVEPEVVPVIPQDIQRLASKLEASMKVVVIEKDDFTALSLTVKEAEKLEAAGFTFYSDIADASVEEITTVLKCTKKKANEIIELAKAM